MYKVKTNSDGSFERYKARLVARGFDQKFGSDYDETFCPVVRMELLRTLIALSTQRGLELHHVDVHTAFLNGTLREEVYMKQPTGYERKGEEHLVCRLRNSIYGLKQSSRCWNTALDAQLERMGFSQSKSNPCIYVSGGEDAFYIGVYVDDMILAGKDKAKMKAVKEELSSKFDIKDLGKLSYFLSMSIVQNQEEGETWIGQPTYTEKLLTKMGMSDCKPVKTPVDQGNRLVKADEDEEALEQLPYQSVVGSLMYLATCTRPDIAYAVGMLARFSSKPNQSHWVAAKRVLQYLKGTMNFGLFYKGGSGVVGYSDADWGGGTWTTESQRPVTCFGSQVDLYHGKAGSRTPWPYRPLKRSMSHCRLPPRSVCGCEDSYLNSEIHQEDPPLSWKTTSHPLLWPGTRNFMGGPSISI